MSLLATIRYPPGVLNPNLFDLLVLNTFRAYIHKQSHILNGCILLFEAQQGSILQLFLVLAFNIYKHL